MATASMRTKLAAGLAIVVLAGSLAACSNEEVAFEAKTYTPEEGVRVTGIDVQVADRAITVVSSEDGRFHIDYAESPEEFYDVFVSDDGVLTMALRTDKDWEDYVGVSDYDGAEQITVRVPDVALATLSLSTTREDISLCPLDVTERLSLSNNGGDISFENAGDADSIEVENKNGNIEGTIAGSYDDYSIESSIKKGDSNLPEQKDGGVKALVVANNNGNIDVEFAAE